MSLVLLQCLKLQCIFDKQKIMYRDRNTFPHQLSYSAVGPVQSNQFEFSPHLSQFSQKDEIFQNQAQTKRSFKQDQNTEFAFLRHTVGPNTTSDFNHLRLNDSKKIDMSLRQTMNLTTDFKKVVRIEGPFTQKRTSRAITANQIQRNTKNYPQEFRNDDRLSKIMDKYEKKNQTKEALKLLQELKQLKKKQQELKNQRKNNPPKEVQKMKKNTENRYEVNSPINFSKKNKIQNYTPTYQSESLSTNANSPQNVQSSLNELGLKKSQDLQRDDSSTSIQNRTYDKGAKPIFSSPNVEKLANIYHQTKSITGDRNFQKSSADWSESRGFLKDKKTDYSYSNDFEANKSKQTKPLTSYRPSTYSSNLNQNILNVTTHGISNFSKSPSNKYKETPSSLNSTVSFNGYQTAQYKNPSRTSALSSWTITKDVFVNKNVSISDFFLGRNLGEGKFGTVYQAFDRRTKGVYALKKIPKSTIKSNWMIDQFILEVKIQQFCNHPNILSLHGVFDDMSHVYILLQYMEEGTLFLHLKKNTTLNQKQAAAKIKQIASAIQYLHENGIAHRDLKPENIVMSHGVCKLCDFGWATICDQRRKTYCGTFDYAAPQILEGEQYDMSVDLWCLGILTYEILVGKAPFYHISRKETMKKIMNCQNEHIAYPSSMSYEARSFIEQLLKKNPEQRLKSEDLLKHPFILMADK